MTDQTPDETPEDEVLTEPVNLAAGGWCAPSEIIYPDLAVRRGGITFAAPKPLTKKQLKARLDHVEPALKAARRENRKLRRKNRRLVKLIARLA